MWILIITLYLIFLIKNVEVRKKELGQPITDFGRMQLSKLAMWPYNGAELLFCRKNQFEKHLFVSKYFYYWDRDQAGKNILLQKYSFIAIHYETPMTLKITCLLYRSILWQGDVHNTEKVSVIPKNFEQKFHLGSGQATYYVSVE